MIYTKDIIKNHTIGDYTYGGPEIIDRWGGKLTIGKYCSIAKNVTILLGGNHNTDWVTTYPFVRVNDEKDIHPRNEEPVIIGNDVWIGMDVLILPGVTIGDGAIIGARTVVSRDIGSYCICVGNPGRVVKKDLMTIL